MDFVTTFFYSQLFVTPPEQTQSWTGKTVAVTGSSAGLGLEAAKLLAARNPKRLILAVRNVSKGEGAKREILAAAPACPSSAIEVWPLDLDSYESVKAFAARAETTLDRLDGIVAGASLGAPTKYYASEEDEQLVTTNVVSTFLLLMLILPLLRRSARQFSITPTMTVITSELAAIAKFPEGKLPADQIFPTLSNKETARLDDRYQSTKLMQVMMVRQLARRLGTPEDTPIIINAVNPGLNRTPMTTKTDGMPLLQRVGFWLLLNLVGRRPELGARTYVAGACGGRETHGLYMSDAIVALTPPTATGKEAEAVSDKVWTALIAKLEKIAPGVSEGL